MPQTLEERVTTLEQEMRELRQAQQPAGSSAPEAGNNRWINKIFGVYKDDPLFEEAMKAGEEYRKSQIPDYMKDNNPDAALPA